jgi:hypothetical protein
MRVQPVAAVPTTNLIGSVITNNVDIIEFTPALDTNIYADNDVLFIATEIPNFFRTAGGKAKLVSCSVFDGADQGTDISLFLTTDSTTPGTINAAISAADTVMDGIQGFLQFVAAGYEDLINSQVNQLNNINMILEAASGSTSLYAWGAVRSGTPTYAASSLLFRFGVERY